MTYIYREYGRDDYIQTDIKNFDTLYKECLRKYGEFVIYKQKEFYIDGEFQCYYPHPIFVKNRFGETRLNIDINKISNVQELNIDNIKDIRI